MPKILSTTRRPVSTESLVAPVRGYLTVPQRKRRRKQRTRYSLVARPSFGRSEERARTSQTITYPRVTFNRQNFEDPRTPIRELFQHLILRATRPASNPHLREGGLCTTS